MNKFIQTPVSKLEYGQLFKFNARQRSMRVFKSLVPLSSAVKNHPSNKNLTNETHWLFFNNCRKVYVSLDHEVLILNEKEEES